MLKKSIESWKEFYNLNVEWNKWCRRHWKGYLATLIIYLALVYEWFYGFTHIKKITKAHGIKGMKWGVK